MPSTSSSVVRAAAVAAARELTTVAVMYHATVGERLGLGPTDEKALDLLRQHGSLYIYFYIYKECFYNIIILCRADYK